MDFQVKIDGKKLDLADKYMLLGIEVDLATNMPAMFVLRFGDHVKAGTSKTEFVHLDSTVFKIGAKVEISAKEFESKSFKPVGKGLEIVSIEPVFGDTGMTHFVVRGYDKSHRMRRGTKTRTFLDQSDSAAIKKVCGDYGVQVDVKGLTSSHPYLIQHNQSDWDFIQARAELFGCVLRVGTDGKLRVEPVATKSGSPIKLDYTDDWVSFSPRITAASQVGDLVVLGYDSSNGKAVKAKAQTKITPTLTAKAKSEPKKGVQKKSEYTLTQYPSIKSAFAKKFADGMASRIGSEVVEARGHCLGKVAMQPGAVIKIDGVGKRFSGEYQLTGVTHKLGANKQFITEFRIANHDTLRSLVSKNGLKVTENRIDGVVVGVVTNIQDKEKLGRVKVKFPWLGQDIESEWARVATPMASTKAGVFFPLAVNDEVLVAFEHGDPNAPFVVGSLYSKKIKNPNEKAISGSDVNFLTFKGRSGHYIEFSEKSGKEQIGIFGVDKGNYLKFDTKKGKLEIKMAKAVEIKCKDFKVESSGSIQMKASRDVEITSQSKVSVEAQQKIVIKGGMAVELSNNSGKSVKIGAATVNINSGALEVM